MVRSTRKGKGMWAEPKCALAQRGLGESAGGGKRGEGQRGRGGEKERKKSSTCLHVSIVPHVHSDAASLQASVVLRTSSHPDECRSLSAVSFFRKE